MVEKLQIHAPEKLQLVNEQKEPYFKYATGNFSSFSKHGFTFVDINPDGYARATGMIDAGVTKEEAIELFAKTVANANKLEAQINAALAEFNELVASVEDAITVE
jgi:hypothetical protein